MIPSKEEIISTFRFRINFDAWKYDQDYFIDEERVGDIYYERNNSDYNRDDDNFQGYLFFTYEENGKTLYEQYVFVFRKEGFISEPLESTVKTISKKLTYLGREIFIWQKRMLQNQYFLSHLLRIKKTYSDLNKK